jgi:hypothetical protein
MADTRRARRLQSRRQRTLRGSSSAKSSRTGILLGVAGALIAALLVYQVFMKSDDTPVATGTPAPAAAVAPEGMTTTTVPLEPELPNGSFDELSLRDPFEPQVSTGSGSSGGTTDVPDVPDTTPPDTTPIPTTPTTTPAQNPGSTTEVALIDITDVNGVLTARVRVGSTEYPDVVAGGVFGPSSNYVLVSFDGTSCANFTYADSPFKLCVGEQVLK